MHKYIKSCLYFIFFILIILKLQLSVYCLSIPDQHLTLGKLFYYKLNLNETQRKNVINIELNKISDSKYEKLPYWFIFRNFTFIGFPVPPESIIFISIKINFKNKQYSRDVFLLSTTTINSQSKTQSIINFMDDQNNLKKEENCEIYIDKIFTPEDLWKTIVYLMPKSLSDSMSEDNDNTNLIKQNPNIYVNDWARDLFTITESNLFENNKGLKLLINNQPCARNLNDLNDLQYKLTKIGINYIVNKTLKSNLHISENDDDDEDLFNIFNDNYYNNNKQNLNLNLNRRHLKRNSQIYSTPVLNKNWMSVSLSNLISSNLITNKFDLSHSTKSNIKVTPNLSTTKNLFTLNLSLSTPDFHSFDIHGTVPLFSSDLLTPHYPFTLLKNIYATPSFIPEPTTEFINADLLTPNPTPTPTPTPTFTFIISDTIKEFSSNQLLKNNIQQILPTLSINSNIVSSTNIILNNINIQNKTNSLSNLQSNQKNETLNKIIPIETITKKKDLTFDSVTTKNMFDLYTSKSKNISFNNQTIKNNLNMIKSSKTDLPNRSPIINQRIPKLKLTSGVYWRYVIPENTFSDYETGNTRYLEISFAPKDKYAENIVPADLFIQFDRENQILTALPTDDNIGRHKFVLTAADFSGLMVSDDLEISVVQHKLSRSFTHKFTLENVIWNVNIPLVEAVYNLMKKISFLFNNRNVDSIFLQKVEVIKSELMQNGELNRSWNITWTNSSLPTYPCPELEILNIFHILAQKSSKIKENTQIPPSLILRKTLDPEYQIDFVRYSLSSTCYHPTLNHMLKNPVLRNNIKNITFELGSVLIFQIPSDTFSSPKQGDTRDLMLELLSDSGFIVDRRDCIGLLHENQTIYGLALTEHFISEDKSYRLIARDPDLNTYDQDIFALQILPDLYKNQYNFDITLQFKSNINIDMDLLTKVNIANKIANSVFDGDLTNLKVLKIKKLKYLSSYKTNLNYQKDSQKDSQIDTQKRNNFFLTNQYNINPMTFYEYVISNSSLVSSTNCPLDKIQNLIVNKLFGSNSDSEIRLKKLRELFLPDYDLVYVGFRSIGKCKNYISPTFMGSKLIAEHKHSEYDDLFSTTEKTTYLVTKPVIRLSTKTREDDYLLRTIIPAILIIIIIFLLSCLIIIILVRFKRNHDKNRFDITSNTYGVAETESFLHNGRIPVILESDLNPNVHLLQQQNYINPMTPMKHFNRNPYQNLTHEPHRRPPPIYKSNQHMNTNS